MVTDKLFSYLVQLEGRYTRLDMFCQFAKRPTNELVGLAHQLNFIFSLQKYLHTGLVRTHATTVDTTRIKQAIIVTHQQVTFNLLESVENNTDQDQQ